ncbi:MAG: methionyl-tRNA formyltransferase [Calditrichaeota bacterium]|nr:methionyl-tRNA formyltransferase [Calditrichota bacterium]
MGTPEFAVHTLKVIINSKHKVVAVVTGVDKPAGRSLKTRRSAVKQIAEEYDLPVLQPSDLKASSFEVSLSSFKPDIGVVVAFRILPERVLNIPRLGCINLHPSLLPELRGAAPINWALINGLTETGVTVFQIQRKVDTGGILLQEKTGITVDDNAGSLSARLSKIGAANIIRVLDALEDGKPEPLPQSGEVTLAPRIDRDLRKINWEWSALHIHNLVRGLTPYPGALSMLDKKILKISKTKPNEKMYVAEPGAVVITETGEFYVSTGDGCLEILELQLEGKKMMTSKQFLRGYKIRSGTKLV